MTGKRRAEAAESLGWVVGSDAHVFRAEIDELSIVRLNEERTKLIIESWEPGRGLQGIER